MKVLYINSVIDTEYTENLLNKLSELLSESDDNIIIYLSSDGGYPDCGKIIIDYLNMHTDKIELVLSDQVNSTAFDIAYEFKGHKRLLDDVFSVVHKVCLKVDINDFRDKNSINYHRSNHYDKVYRDYDFLTNEELERYNNGQDIFLDHERLKTILNND